jgi:hypothetical protein
MTEKDRENFANLIAEMLEFYRQKTSKFALTAWWRVCAPYALSEVRDVLVLHTSDGEHGRFVPMPADARQWLEALPRRQWAADAGFPNRWGAGSAGCDAHTAGEFRDGKRISERSA